MNASDSGPLYVLDDSEICGQILYQQLVTKFKYQLVTTINELSASLFR